MEIATLIFTYILLLGYLMFFVTNIASQSVSSDGEGVQKCRTRDGYQGYCLMSYQCKNNARKDIKRGGEDLLTPKQSANDILDRCPRERGVRQWCCRHDITPTCGGINSGKREYYNGRDTVEFGEWPWSVDLISTNLKHDLQDRNGHFCSGSLIHPRVVLTAAHCFTKRKASEIRVELGAHNLYTVYGKQTIEVKQIIIHEKYYEGGQQNNIALLQLSWPAKLKNNVGTVCLPNAGKTIDTKCYASSRGQDKNNIAPSKLAKIQMKVVPNKQCQKDYNRARRANINIPGHSLCAISQKGDKCPVNGGSVLACQVEHSHNVYMQYGVMSFSNCRTASPGVYVEVASYRDWIDITIRQLGYDTRSYTYT